MTEHAPASQPDQEYSRRDRKKSRGRLFIALGVVVALAAAVIAFFAIRGGGAQTDDELSVGLVLEPQNLDIRNTAGVSLDQILIDNVYQGLVGLEPGSIDDFRPVLAADMPDVSDNGREYTFTLRDDVVFHSGSALTAEDVVSSLEATLSADLLGGEVQIAAPDETTVQISLAQPNSELLWHLSSRPGLILEAAADNDLANSANGTGPYLLEEWRQGDSLVLRQNEEYWGTPATIGTVVFRFFPEGRAAVNALKEGDVDVHTALLPSLRPEFEDDENFTLVRADSSDVFTLAYNSAAAPFDDPRVREAMSRAIDTEALIAAQNGDGKPLGSPITELEPGFTDLTDVNSYDPAAARALLSEAGHPNPSLTLTAPNHYDTVVLDLITSQLADVGVSVRVKQVEFATWIEEVYTNRDYQLSYIDHAEARDFANYANPDYYFGYDSAAVQELYAESLAATDPEEADRLLAEAAEQVAEDAPAKWLYNYTPTNVVSSSVSGFPDANTNSRINLEGVTLR